MLLRAAESHTTPNEAGKARQAQNWGGAYLRLIKPPTSNIKHQTIPHVFHVNISRAANFKQAFAS